MVLPKWLRRELGADPGEVELRRTSDGVLVSAVTPPAVVATADDGLPVMRLGRPVGNDEVLAAIDAERRAR